MNNITKKAVSDPLRYDNCMHYVYIDCMKIYRTFGLVPTQKHCKNKQI